MPNFDIFENKDFQLAFKNQTVYVAKKAGAEYNVEWDDIFDLLDTDIKDGKPCGRNRFENGGYRILNAIRIPVILEANNKLLKFFKPTEYTLEKYPVYIPGRSAELYVNITTSKGTYGTHHYDPENVIFWNIKGKSKWTIYEKSVTVDRIDEDKVEVEVILEPGDVLFCPHSRVHKVEPLTPRFGVSLGFGQMI
jgi:hypothetical protein